MRALEFIFIELVFGLSNDIGDIGIDPFTEDEARENKQNSLKVFYEDIWPQFERAFSKPSPFEKK
jgi:hypothetical protein